MNPTADGDRLLVVEDDPELGPMLVELFDSEGYRVDLAPDGQCGLHRALTRDYDALIVDRGLPAIDGLDLLRRLRRGGLRSGVLFLTAFGTVGDRVAGLDAGAEDYLVKPFEVDELLARVRALLRRGRPAEPPALGSAVLDADRRVVRLADRREVTLSGREYELLALLTAHPTTVYRREELRRRVFRDAPAESIVDTYVYYLRRKLGRDAVRTVRGIGYQAGLGVTDTVAEHRLLARGRWLLTAQIAAVITGVVLLVGVVSWVLMVRGQHADSRHELAESLRTATVEHPWPCVWMFAERDGTLRRTPAAPAALPVRTDLAAVSRQHPVLVSTHRIGDVDYLVRTEWHPDRRVQASLDLRYQSAERTRLYVALAVAEAIGLAAAAASGRLLAGRAIRPLAEALGRQQRFVADASHELRTPLTQLHTRAQLLHRRLRNGTDRVAAEEVGRLVEGTRQFGEVLDDLLLSAQLGSRQHTERVELSGVVTATVTAEDARIRRRGLHVTVSTGPGPFQVRGAAAALRRVVTALVDNAIGHTPAGGTIRVVLDREADVVVLTVCDNGVGLKIGSAERVFDRFAHGEHGVGRRFGLGLALTREVVTRHGGTITAAGTPGQGATFTVRLPATESAADPAAPPSGQRRLPVLATPPDNHRELPSAVPKG